MAASAVRAEWAAITALFIAAVAFSLAPLIPLDNAWQAIPGRPGRLGHGVTRR